MQASFSVRDMQSNYVGMGDTCKNPMLRGACQHFMMDETCKHLILGRRCKCL